MELAVIEQNKNAINNGHNKEDQTKQTGDNRTTTHPGGTAPNASSFPPYVSRPIVEWSVDDVYEWAKQVLDVEEAEKLKNQKIKGTSLLQVTEERLHSYGILGGPAVDLITARDNMKATQGPVGNRILPSAKNMMPEKDESQQFAIDMLQKLSQPRQNLHAGDESLESIIINLDRKINELQAHQEQLYYRMNQMQQDIAFAKQAPFKMNLQPAFGFADRPMAMNEPPFTSPFTISPRHAGPQQVILPMPTPPISVQAPISPVQQPTFSPAKAKPNDENFSRSPTPPIVVKDASDKANARSKGGEKGSPSEKEIKKNDTKLLRKGPRNRVKWTPELIDLFQAALKKLGDSAVPSAILDEMGVTGLTRENVASHLQKHRLQHAAKVKTQPASPTIHMMHFPNQP